MFQEHHALLLPVFQWSVLYIVCRKIVLQTGVGVEGIVRPRHTTLLVDLADMIDKTLSVTCRLWGARVWCTNEVAEQGVLLND